MPDTGLPICVTCQKRPAFFTTDSLGSGWWEFGLGTADVCVYCVRREQLRHMVRWLPAWRRVPMVLIDLWRFR